MKPLVGSAGRGRAAGGGGRWGGVLALPAVSSLPQSTSATSTSGATGWPAWWSPITSTRSALASPCWTRWARRAGAALEATGCSSASPARDTGTTPRLVSCGGRAEPSGILSSRAVACPDVALALPPAPALASQTPPSSLPASGFGWEERVRQRRRRAVIAGLAAPGLGSAPRWGSVAEDAAFCLFSAYSKGSREEEEKKNLLFRGEKSLLARRGGRNRRAVTARFLAHRCWMSSPGRSARWTGLRARRRPSATRPWTATSANTRYGRPGSPAEAGDAPRRCGAVARGTPTSLRWRCWRRGVFLQEPPRCRPDDQSAGGAGRDQNHPGEEDAGARPRRWHLCSGPGSRGGRPAFPVPRRRSWSCGGFPIPPGSAGLSPPSASPRSIHRPFAAQRRGLAWLRLSAAGAAGSPPPARCRLPGFTGAEVAPRVAEARPRLGTRWHLRLLLGAREGPGCRGSAPVSLGSTTPWSRSWSAGRSWTTWSPNRRCWGRSPKPSTKPWVPGARVIPPLSPRTPGWAGDGQGGWAPGQGRRPPAWRELGCPNPGCGARPLAWWTVTPIPAAAVRGTGVGASREGWAHGARTAVPLSPPSRRLFLLFPGPKAEFLLRNHVTPSLPSAPGPGAVPRRPGSCVLGAVALRDLFFFSPSRGAAGVGLVPCGAGGTPETPRFSRGRLGPLAFAPVPLPSAAASRGSRGVWGGLCRVCVLGVSPGGGSGLGGKERPS